MPTAASAFTDWRLFAELFLMDFWLLRLAINLAGYASVVVPSLLVYYYLKKNGHLILAESPSTKHKWFYRAIRVCILGSPPVEQHLPDTATGKIVVPGGGVSKRSSLREASLLVFCFVGLWGTYLTWGVLQEKLMTQLYCVGGNAPSVDVTPTPPLAEGTPKCERFRESQFLVFVNRISAFLVSLTYITATSRSGALQPSAPLYKYSYASFSNIMSSWCQYEVLKFITFPTQVLCKSSKIMAVMLMGWLVSRRSYPAHQYATAALISVGIAMFMLSNSSASHASKHKSAAESQGNADSAYGEALSGVLLMIGYLGFDSFTSNWQADLFQRYRMSSMQMMCGVNLFSSLFTLVSLLEQGSFMFSIEFALRHFPQFAYDVAVLSFCSAFGQLFIFYTISKFGAVTFTIIMTVRQAMAILLSCLIYGHEVTSAGVVGIITVFVALLFRTYLNQRYKKAPSTQNV